MCLNQTWLGQRISKERTCRVLSEKLGCEHRNLLARLKYRANEPIVIRRLEPCQRGKKPLKRFFQLRNVRKASSQSENSLIHERPFISAKNPADSTESSNDADVHAGPLNFRRSQRHVRFWYECHGWKKQSGSGVGGHIAQKWRALKIGHPKIGTQKRGT